MLADQGREYSVIVDGARTAFGRYGGALAPLSAVDLGAAAIRGALERTGGMVKDEALDHALMGVVLAAGLGQVPSRQATVAMEPAQVQRPGQPPSERGPGPHPSPFLRCAPVHPEEPRLPGPR